MTALASRISSTSSQIRLTSSSPKSTRRTFNNRKSEKWDLKFQNQDLHQLSPDHNIKAENLSSGDSRCTFTSSTQTCAALSHPDETKISRQSETNPFEHAFSSRPSTAKKNRVPSVADLTSPSCLERLERGEFWQPPRKVGPAVQPGQAGLGECYFRGVPTTNESSLRTGPTPGGGGPMFPEPSSNSQTLYNIQRGSSNQSSFESCHTTHGPIQKLHNSNTAILHSVDDNAYEEHVQMNAASNLMSFSQNSGWTGSSTSEMQNSVATQPHKISSKANNTIVMNNLGSKRSIDSVSGSAKTGELSESEQSDQEKGGDCDSTNGKRPIAFSNAKGGARRCRINEGGTKTATKRTKYKTGISPAAPQHLEPMDMELYDSEPERGDGEEKKKIMDDEKRKNFLERNRIAALKCRQRKKQWLVELQKQNEALLATVTRQQDEIVNLKALLSAHKDCSFNHRQSSVSTALNGLRPNLSQIDPYGIVTGMRRQGGTSVGQSIRGMGMSIEECRRC